MFIGSINPLSKCHLDDVSIGTDITEASTDSSDTDDNLKEKNDLLKKLFEEPDEVVEEVIAGAKDMKDHKTVSSDIPGKIWRIDRDTAEKTLEITS